MASWTALLKNLLVERLVNISWETFHRNQNQVCAAKHCQNFVMHFSRNEAKATLNQKGLPQSLSRSKILIIRGGSRSSRSIVNLSKYQKNTWMAILLCWLGWLAPKHASVISANALSSKTSFFSFAPSLLAYTGTESKLLYRLCAWASTCHLSL